MAPGGIETLVLDLARAEGAEHRIAIFSLEGSRAELIEAWPALREFETDLYAFGAAPSGRRFTTVPPLIRTMREVGARQVFAHHIGPLLYGGIAARLAMVRRLVHVEHDAWHYDENSSHIQILKACERVLRPHHFAVSRPIKKRLGELTDGRAKISIVPPGIDTTRFEPGDRIAARERLELPLDCRLIGTVGRLNAVKGHSVLIEAMQWLADDVQLLIVGEGVERQRLEQQIASLGLKDRITLAGHRDDMTSIYPALDVFCLPSHNEGLPRVVIEAQACGVPVVASDVGAMRDAVCHETGRLTAPGDADDVARALNEVLGWDTDADRTRAFVCSNFEFSTTKQFYSGRPLHGLHEDKTPGESVSALC